MSDLFARLVSRAWDTGPRVRPQITPRFAPRAASFPVEEIVQEIEGSAPREGRAKDVSEGSPPPPAPPAVRPELSLPSVLRSAEAERPPAPPAPRANEPPPPSPPPLTLERTLEHIFATTVERMHLIGPPAPALAPPAIRPADLAVLRPAEGERTAPPRTEIRGAVAPRSITGSPPPAPSAPEPIQITIGRIDVRAIPTTAPRAPAPSKPTHAPLALDEYLRRRNEGR